VNKKKSYIFHT